MKLLQSKKLAIGLIIALTIASLAGVIIPQGAQDKGEFLIQALGLNQVFQTKWFLILSIIFFVNLSSCTIGQISRLRKLRQAVLREGQSSSNKYWGAAGNCIFHIGLVIVTVGGLLTLSYKMSGYVEIAECETFVEQHQNYLSVTEGALFNENHLGFQLSVSKLNRSFKENGQLDYVVANLAVTDNGREPFEESAELGQPFSYRGITFYYLKSGFAPFVTIKNPQGENVMEGYALFNSVWRNETGEYNMDLTLPGSKLILKARFYPDAVRQAGSMTTKTLKVVNPVIQATLLEEKKPVGNIQFKPGQNATIQGWAIGMNDVRLWAGFEVVRDPGAPVVFSGFVICLIGLIISFMFSARKPRREQENGS